MPRPLTLSLDGEEFAVNLAKVAREDLYGTVEIEAFDEKKNPAEIKVLAADGITLIDQGGTALEVLDADGNSLDRKSIKPVDRDGKVIQPTKSSFDETNVLRETDVEDYLSMVVKSVYLLTPTEGEELGAIRDLLHDGRIYTFPFSYRPGVDSDEAFLISNNESIFMITGRCGTLQYLKLNQAATLDAPEEEEISGDEISFDLL